MGDEKHVISECPVLQCFGEEWSNSFQGLQKMQAFMWQDDLLDVAKSVNACLNRVKPPVSGRSAWCGGT